ncbi:FAD-dependent oxidoreductase [Kaistia geumhonensis]|uniref:NAD(P)/FAD-dependent oxidoreductase n=1 Tax=Kaistia geumhonensis TaxID=410839 RepID=UPI00225B2D76|nr:FAD-dependent oxidoreductase [Kaistia geumhonensis]MCX5479552.1 FAD-dependent oxidoreductase [Kaistia geumhonensis]
MSDRRARPHVVVVGAGIVGASIAWHLAQSGCRVTLVEAEAEAGRGVTGRAFGWINLIHGDHSNRRAHDLQRRAVAAHEALGARLPAAYAGMRRGSLLWLGSPAETAALIDRKAAAGADVRPAELAEIERLEPRLRDAPALAAFSPSDMAVDAAGLSQALADGAEALGAVFRRGDTVRSIRLAGDKVTGVETEAGRLEANCVVIAAGPGTASLLEPLGIDIALEIFTGEAAPPRMRRPLYFPYRR